MPTSKKGKATSFKKNMQRQFFGKPSFKGKNLGAERKLATTKPVHKPSFKSQIVKKLKDRIGKKT